MPSGFLDWVAIIVMAVVLAGILGTLVWAFYLIAGWWAVPIIAGYSLFGWSFIRTTRLSFRSKRL